MNQMASILSLYAWFYNDTRHPVNKIQSVNQHLNISNVCLCRRNFNDQTHSLVGYKLQ